MNITDSGGSLFVEMSAEGDVLTASIATSNISQRESEIIGEAIQKGIADHSSRAYLLIDMSQVTFMSSMGIGMLVDARSRAAGSGMKVVLGNVTKELEQLLKMVKLDKVFTICTDEKQLNKALKR